MSTSTLLCIASFEKGQTFMRECKALGWRVLLLTGESLREADWPTEAIDQIYFLPDPNKEWNTHHMVNAVSYVARTEKIDRIVPMDDFDVEKAALLREHLRVVGMGDTTARNFRDKLAMRGRAKDANILIPRFVGLINNAEIEQFVQEVPAPWIVKPRFQANAIGMTKCHTLDDLRKCFDELGDARSNSLMEEFVSGHICHVDSIIDDKKVLFAQASKYGTPPFEVFHGGRVFVTQTLAASDPLSKELLAANQMVIESLNLKAGVSHTEFIQAEDGRILFLETSARVGGAHIAEMVEAATGINLWKEWARIELQQKYKVPKTKKQHAALLVTLAKQEWPDMSAYDAPEVCWKINKRQHAGLIVASSDLARVNQLVNDYTARFYEDFFAKAPAAKSASEMG